MKINRLIAAILIFVSALSWGIIQPVYGSNMCITLRSGKLDGYNKYTPERNLFSIESVQNRKFVLLDSDENGFLILADEIYATKVFDSDGTQKFDPNDESNIAHWLNNDMLEDEAMLPPEIIPYIDRNRVWTTEPGSPSGNCPETYDVTCGVALLSYTEFMEYYKKFGLQYDAMKKDWYLRSPLGSSQAKDTGIVVGGTYATEGQVSSGSTVLNAGIRPVFWVTRDFFKDVRIFIPTVGEAVTEALGRSYSLEELKNGKAAYSDYECSRLGWVIAGMKDEYINIFFPNAPIYAQNQADAYVSVQISITGNEDIEYTAEYSANGTFNDAVGFSVMVKPYQEQEIRLNLSSLKKMKYSDFAVRVKNRDGILKIDSKPVTIMEFVTAQPLFEYSKIGINWQPDFNTSNYSAGQDVESFNKILDMMGITKTRGIHRWEYTEGVRSNQIRANGRHAAISGFMKDYGQTFSPYILGMKNSAFFPEEPRTYRNVIDEINYCRDISEYLFERGVGVDCFEIWNEANLPSYWGSSRSITYSQLANRMAFEMKKLYPDIPIVGAAISHGGGPFLNLYLKRGAMSYVDGYSIHPYSYPTSPDKLHYERSKEYMDMRRDAGGWMDVYSTEVGFPTHIGTSGVSQPVQAEYIPKMYVYNDELDIAMTDLYTLENRGYDDTYREHEFGIVQMDKVPKNSVVSLAQLQKYCGNAEYIGRFPVNDTSYMYIYNKLGKLFAILWSCDDEQDFEYTLGSGEIAEDLYGNSIEPKDGKITIGQSMVYLNGISDSYLARAVAYMAESRFDEIAEYFSDEVAGEEMSALAERFTWDDAASRDKLLAGIKAIYDFGTQKIERYAEDPSGGNLERTASLLFELQIAAKRAAAAYAYYDIPVSNSNDVYNEVCKKIADKKGDEPDSGLFYADSIMRYAAKYNKKANDIAENYPERFDGKDGIIAEQNIMTVFVCGWAEKIMQLEERDTGRAVFMYLEDTNPTLYTGQTFEYSVEVENLRNNDINGSVVWRDQNENAIGPESVCAVKTGEHTTVKYSGTVPADCEFGSHTFYLDIMENDKLLKRSEVDVTIGKKLEAEIEKVRESVDDLSEIAVDITNTFNDTVMGTVIMEAPDGWELQSNERRFSIAAGDTQKISFKLEKTQKVPYNDYYFKFEVKDYKDNLLAQSEGTLDFLIAVKADSEIDAASFDGDISGWENAYPIHINLPDKMRDLNSWRNANLAVKSLMKWDENYVYILTDVWDDLYTQSYTGANMWKGDSVQVSFDTLNDKSTAYSSDDYEYGVSVTQVGLEVQAWQTPPDKMIGDKPPEWASVIRDNENHITRYLFKIPGKELMPLSIVNGGEFGFNLCVNDADILDRDTVIQFTQGTGGAKNPSYYETFRFVDADAPAKAEEGKEYGFITKINNDGFVN